MQAPLLEGPGEFSFSACEIAFYDLISSGKKTVHMFCFDGPLKVTFLKQFPTTASGLKENWISRCFDCQDDGLHWWDNHLPQCTMGAPVVAMLCMLTAVASFSRGAKQLQKKSTFQPSYWSPTKLLELNIQRSYRYLDRCKLFSPTPTH